MKVNSYERDFENELLSLKLLIDNIEPLELKLYQGIDMFYLADKSDKYLGHLEYDVLEQNIIKIRNSFSKLRKEYPNAQQGFYELLFKLVLVKTPIKMIFGDDEQSEFAMKSWKKMLSKYKKTIFNTETKKVEEFDDSKTDEYWTSDRYSKNAKKYLVGLSEFENLIWSFANGEQLLESRRSKGRLAKAPNDMLVRFYWTEPEDAKDMIKMIEELYGYEIY